MTSAQQLKISQLRAADPKVWTPARALGPRRASPCAILGQSGANLPGFSRRDGCWCGVAVLGGRRGREAAGWGTGHV